MKYDLQSILEIGEKKGCAIPAFNVYNLETVLGVLNAAQETGAPVIFQMYSRLFDTQEARYVAPAIMEAIDTLKTPAAFHLDHGAGEPEVMRALRYGATGVMIDASVNPLEENIAQTRRVVELAGAVGVGVEGELGHVGTTKDEVMAAFTGKISQIPPMYSAVKVNGKRLYQLARQGKTVERAAREITIYEMEIQKIELPLVTFRVRCSKGTYIRTLCSDIGEKLGTGAAMEHLLRTRVGRFTLSEAITLDEAEAIMKSDDPEKIRGYILPVDDFFEEAPRVHVEEAGMRYLLNGNTVRRKMTDLAPGTQDGYVRMYDRNDKFYALYRYDGSSDEMKSVKMFLS